MAHEKIIWEAVKNSGGNCEIAHTLSSDGQTVLYLRRHLPAGKARGILQIAHGMVEFIERYDAFASWMAERGWLVAGNDHLGHGASVRSEEDWGYFADENGWDKLLLDMRELSRILKEENPDIPHITLGHSMGSFLLRSWLWRWPGETDAAVIMASGRQPKALLRFAYSLSSFLTRLRGPRFRSEFISKLVFSSNNRAFEPAESKNAWLSRDAAAVAAYDAEPRNQFLFTTKAYQDLFGGLLELTEQANLAQMKVDTPLLFVGGAQDPVGDFGKALPLLAQDCKACGCQRVDLKLFPENRHEILNELEREEVWQFLNNWMEKELFPES